jgi:uncharacterized integral membrane protein
MTVSPSSDEPRPPATTEEPGASDLGASPAGAVGSPAPPASANRAAVEPAIPRTRASTTYVALICGLVVLVLLLVFILENTRRVPVTFFGATGDLPLGVALLLSAIAGAVVLGIVGTVRIAQLRRRVKRARRS